MMIPTHPSRPMSARVRLGVLALLGAAAVTAACYEDPQAKMDQAQQMTDMLDVVNDLQSRTSELQFTLDSLRGIIARQDTTIARLANLAGVPYQR